MCAYGVYRNSLSDCLIRDWIWIDFGEGYVFIFKINISKFIIKWEIEKNLDFMINIRYVLIGIVFYFVK